MTDTPHSQIPDDVIALAGKLFDAARAGDETALSSYLSAGAPATLTNESGDTLMMLAAYHGHPALVRLLGKHGADVETANDRGQTPLAGAVFKGHSEVVDELLALGANPDAGSPTARQAAHLFGRAEILDRFGTAG
ncbi:ankyrin repeat domain-containing protein [Sinomonas sp. ASV486]|uniref:ankyrin repeat domain-containing protein n=1 Tax=Sinomonas sp. ASV486 TaxID=3051170 RepID=UPI0027DAEE15|nr:ankyrin repeat domain-containing protein [Sinomonas sp. ASV486]MDQ4488718.1 ankyrin repeat domain-containing protein [Sinomonas sp. ASV486]